MALLAWRSGLSPNQVLDHQLWTLREHKRSPYQACLHDWELRDSPSKMCPRVISPELCLVVFRAMSWVIPELYVGLTPRVVYCIGVTTQLCVGLAPIVVDWGDPSELGFRG